MAQIFPHLEMHQVFARIAVNTRNARLDIRQPHAELTVRQPKAEMNVERTPAKIRIDQTDAWHNLDLKSAIVRNAEAAAAGRQAVLDGIARRSREGEVLLHIEKNKGKNLIAKIAADNVPLSVIGTDYNTGNIPPFQAVKIDATPARLDMTWKQHRPEIQTTPHPPQYTYRPGEVDISMQQYPELHIQAVGLFVDEKG